MEKSCLTLSQVRLLCDNAIKSGDTTVSVPPAYVNETVEYVQGKIKISTTIGHSEGQTTTATKVFETADAVLSGASEVAVALNLGWVKDGLWDNILEEISAIKTAAGNCELKVITQNQTLTDSETKQISILVKKTDTSQGGGNSPLPASNIPTPHITAKQGDFAQTVLMPGDPLRAKAIAQRYLSGAVCVNEIRGMLAYTGTYGGKRISVMGSGMGMPSMGIYSYELFSFYGVENIIRIGSAGGIAQNVNLLDIVLGVGACTDSNYAHQYALAGTFAPIADVGLLQKAFAAASAQKIDVKAGNILSSDVFYDDSASLKSWQKMGVLAVEMETAALYMNAARTGKKALAMFTISDCPFLGSKTTALERQEGFDQMMILGLETAIL